MKRSIFISLCVCAAFAAAPALGIEVIPQVITFNENGIGTFDDVGTLDYSIGDPGIDPVPFPTLFYYLPFPVVQGDVAVLEVGPTPFTSTISDVLRFISDAATNTGRVYVYSDMEAGDIEKDLADVGIPQSLSTNVVRVFETGLEGGLNGIIWQPTPNQPGGSPTGTAPITYRFISDVPEPATIGLLAIGSLLLLGRKRKA